jgi:hypothetical protein
MSETAEPRLAADGSERRAIRNLVDLSGNVVVEIGCGKRRIIGPYADCAASVQAMCARESVEVRLAFGSVGEPIVAGRLRPEREITCEFGRYTEPIVVHERSALRVRPDVRRPF